MPAEKMTAKERKEKEELELLEKVAESNKPPSFASYYLVMAALTSAAPAGKGQRSSRAPVSFALRVRERTAQWNESGRDRKTKGIPLFSLSLLSLCLCC